jgi:hypothetical protein
LIIDGVFLGYTGSSKRVAGVAWDNLDNAVICAFAEAKLASELAEFEAVKDMMARKEPPAVNGAMGF